MSRLRPPSPVTPRRQLSFSSTLSSPGRQLPTTPLRQPDPIVRRVAPSPRIPQSPIASSAERRFVSEEKYQEVVRLNSEYENHIRQFNDLLEDTRRKWSQSEEENARLAALNEELRRQLDEVIARNNALQEKLTKSQGADLNVSLGKKLEESARKNRRRSNNFNNKDNFSRSTPKDETLNISFSTNPEKKKSVLRRSSSVSILRVSSSAISNTSLSSAASSSSAVTTSPRRTSTYDNLDKVNSRRHAFGTKRYFDETRCHACSLKICLGFESLKCTVCQTVCHPNCRKNAPSCVPFFEPSQTLDGDCLTLDEYCSDNFQPKLPHLVVRCVQYLNMKTSFKGLYADLSQDAKAESLLELILHDPNASNVGKHGPKVAAHCVLKFLVSLKEPLIPEPFVIGFLKAAQFPEDAQLEKVITELPAVHKNVLAYLLLHWKLLIQESSSNGLTEETLGSAVLPVVMRIPTYEAAIYLSVFHRLLSLPSSFWCSAIDAALLKCPFEENSGFLYARGAVKLQQQKQEKFGRLWG